MQPRLPMKFAYFLLAFAFFACLAHGQDKNLPVAALPVGGAQATSASRSERNATATADPALSQPGAPAPDSFAIHSSGGKDKQDAMLNLWELVKSGGWAMIPLGALSVITVMLDIVFLFTLRRGAVLTPHFMNTADVLLKKRDYLGLLAISSRHSEAIARVVQRTLDFATKNPSTPYNVVREIAETEGGAQAASLQQRITFLADIGIISPMIGLLGTVFGIIRAFAKLGSGEVAVSRDIALASGVSEALVATASGLILGIVAMSSYAVYRNKVNSLISDMEIASTHILGLMSISFNKKRESSRMSVEDDF